MIWHPGAVAQKYADKPAVIFDSAVLTYGQLDHDSAAIAAMLHAQGLAKGHCIALLIGNRPEFFTFAWAAQRSGLYYVPMSTRLTADEIRYILEDSGAKVLFVDPAFVDLAIDAVTGLSIHCHGLDIPYAKYAAAPAIEGNDMLYTSGTTGKPKGVRRPITGEPLGSDGKRVARAKSLFGLGQDSVFLSPAPLYHAAPLRFSMNLLRTGGTVVGMEKFNPAKALGIIHQNRETHSQ